MKQLYATGSLAVSSPFGAADATPMPGRSLQLPAVRASSAGIGADQLSSALPATLYSASQSERPLPVRLALLKTAAGRVLTHAVPNGQSYFAHTLLNVPESADAHLAIQTWGSPLWQRSVPDSSGDLPELPYLPVGDTLDDAALKTWLAAPDKRDLLEFALTAVLGTTGRVFLAAPADDVAKVVFALTRALPSGLMDDFTFSTHEAEPTLCTARLIGFDADAGTDLPGECYRAAGVGMNVATGKRSDLPAEVPFAAFAVNALSSGEFSPLEDVKGTWQRLGLKDAPSFDLVYRMARGTGTLTKAEAAAALQHPPLAAWISGRSDALKQFLEWALDDRAFATGAFSRAVQSLRQKADVSAKLAQTVREKGLAALKDGDHTRTANALEVVLPMVAPTKANAVWGELLAQITDPDALPWPMRWYLLPRFVRFKQQQGGGSAVDPHFTRWLNVPTDRLADVLALDLPRPYQLEAGRVALARADEPTPALAHTLARHPALVPALLQPAYSTADKAVSLYETLLAELPGTPWFETVLANAADYPAPLLSRFFEVTLAGGSLDADRLVRTQGPRLLELFDGQPGLDRLGAKFLATPPADVLTNRTVLGFLTSLRAQPSLTDDLKARIDAVTAIRAYLDKPTFTADAIRPVADALTVTPPAVPPTAKADVFAAVTVELFGRDESDALQADLETVVAHFGTSLATDPTDLFENLLRDRRAIDPRFGSQVNAAHAYLAVALGATVTPELAGKLDGLDGHAFAVASDAAKRGGHKALDAIDARAKQWPKEAQTKWGFLLAAVRPKSRAGRDVSCALIGAAVATVAWFVVKLVG